MILEMPLYHLPTLKSIFNKTWFRVREFIFEAWPLLIAGSAVMAVLNFYKLSIYLNIPVRPVTWVLGLARGIGRAVDLRNAAQGTLSDHAAPGVGGG